MDDNFKVEALIKLIFFLIVTKVIEDTILAKHKLYLYLVNLLVIMYYVIALLS